MSEDLRPSTGDERLALKAAVRRAVKMAGRGASVQHVLRVGEADLSRYGSPEHAARHCPIDVALELDREAGSPVILAALAALQGFRLVRDAEGDGAAPGAGDLAAMAVETAQAIEAVAAAVADGHVTPIEADRMHREIEEAVASLRKVQRKLPGGLR